MRNGLHEGLSLASKLLLQRVRVDEQLKGGAHFLLKQVVLEDGHVEVLGRQGDDHAGDLGGDFWTEPDEPTY